jgi:hypothetical protein
VLPSICTVVPDLLCDEQRLCDDHTNNESNSFNDDEIGEEDDDKDDKQRP